MSAKYRPNRSRNMGTDTKLHTRKQQGAIMLLYPNFSLIFIEVKHEWVIISHKNDGWNYSSMS